MEEHEKAAAHRTALAKLQKPNGSQRIWGGVVWVGGWVGWFGGWVGWLRLLLGPQRGALGRASLE